MDSPAQECAAVWQSFCDAAATPKHFSAANWGVGAGPALARKGNATTAAKADDFKLEPGYESLFNGKDLTGWHGVKGDFSPYKLNATNSERAINEGGKRHPSFSRREALD